MIMAGFCPKWSVRTLRKSINYGTFKPIWPKGWAERVPKVVFLRRFMTFPCPNVPLSIGANEHYCLKCHKITKKAHFWPKNPWFSDIFGIFTRKSPEVVLARLRKWLRRNGQKWPFWTKMGPFRPSKETSKSAILTDFMCFPCQSASLRKDYCVKCVKTAKRRQKPLIWLKYTIMAKIHHFLTKMTVFDPTYLETLA